jgi:hypothetical protein
VNSQENIEEQDEGKSEIGRVETQKEVLFLNTREYREDRIKEIISERKDERRSEIEKTKGMSGRASHSFFLPQHTRVST